MRRKPRQQGFALVLAVFVITVLAALGAYILTVSGVQHQTTVLTLQQTRMLNAARSGIEWGAYQVLASNSCPAATSFTPGGATFSDVTVSVTCNASLHAISGDDFNMYVIDATATAGAYGSPDYVSRHVQATIRGPAP